LRESNKKYTQNKIDATINKKKGWFIYIITLFNVNDNLMWCAVKNGENGRFPH